MGLATRLQATATKLLTKFDESNSADRRCKLVKPAGEPVWDPVNAEYVPQPPTTIDMVGVTVQFSAALVNGTTIQSGDVMFIGTAEAEPTMQDKVLIDGVQWSIVDIPLVDYTGVTIAVKIHCRK